MMKIDLSSTALRFGKRGSEKQRSGMELLTGQTINPRLFFYQEFSPECLDEFRKAFAQDSLMLAREVAKDPDYPETRHVYYLTRYTPENVVAIERHFVEDPRALSETKMAMGDVFAAKPNKRVSQMQAAADGLMKTLWSQPDIQFWRWGEEYVIFRLTLPGKNLVQEVKNKYSRPEGAGRSSGNPKPVREQ